MRAESNNIKVLYIELNRDSSIETPFCKDIFHYKALSAYSVQLTYTLQLFDDYSEIIGEYKADCEMESNQVITSYHLDELMARLSRDGRERFNAEAVRYHIRMYIPRANTLHVINDVEDAA